MELQDKIFHLHNQAHRLLHIECSGSYLYADDLAQLNKDIHNEMNELYPLHGSTPEQDASLCLALLLGYSVSLYASLEDDLKREHILSRSLELLETLPPSPLIYCLQRVYECIKFKIKILGNNIYETDIRRCFKIPPEELL